MSFESQSRLEPTGVWTKIGENISQIGLNTRDLNKDVSDLGTVRDTSALRYKFNSLMLTIKRERLKEKRDDTQKIVVATKELLQKPFDKEDKIKVIKISFNLSN